MPGERFVNFKILPYEAVSRLDRLVAAAQTYIEGNLEQTGILTARFYFTANDAGEVIPTWNIEQKFADRKIIELGRVRDHQLVFPGTGVLSDSPSEEWRDAMLAAPSGRS